MTTYSRWTLAIFATCWIAGVALFRCAPAHGDPRAMHGPSYDQGRQAIDRFSSQSILSPDSLAQTCQNLATNTQFSGPVANPVAFVRGCVDEGRVLLGLS
jgi:hypothetical protein